MKPVRIAESDVVYKGPMPDIGDLWCHRLRPGMVRGTWEPDERERQILAEGGRVQLTIMKEPIPPVMLEVVPAKESEPVGPHGWKVDLEPGDVIQEKEGVNDGEDEDNEQPSAQGTDGGETLGQASEASSS